MKQTFKIFAFLIFNITLLTLPIAEANHLFPVKRFEYWKEQGQILLYISSGLFSRPLWEAAVEVQNETLAILPISLVLTDQPERAKLHLSYLAESQYFKNKDNARLEIYAKVYGRLGTTLVIDDKSKAIDFNLEYQDAYWDHIECLVIDPQTTRLIPFKFQIYPDPGEGEYLFALIKATAKHELYHGLGLMHNNFKSLPFHRGCAIMDYSDFVICSYPSWAELEELRRVWR